MNDERDVARVDEQPLTGSSELPQRPTEDVRTPAPEQIVRVVRVTMDGGGQTSIMAVPKADELQHHGLFEELSMFLAEGTRGDSMEIEHAEMTQAEYDALPDFDGW